MKKTVGLLLLILSISTVGGREWKSADGVRTFSGQLISYSPPKVTVVRADGSRIAFNDELLSEADKRYCTLANRVLSESFPNIPFRVIQVLEHGVMGIEQPYNNPYNTDELFFIWGNYTQTAAEDDVYTQNIYWAGSYQYTTVEGREKTIRSFASSLDEAVAIWEYRLNPPNQEDRNSRFAGAKPEGLSSSGTGFAITDSGYIVTNAHVIEGASSITVLVDERNLPATVVAVDKSNDLALLKVAAATKALFLQSTGSPSLGDPVTAAGFPNPDIQGRSIKITKGILSGLKGMQDDLRHFQIDAAVQPGNSGGPLIDGSGSVIGIVNARLNDAAVALATGSIPQNVNYAIKVDYLTALLKTASGLVEEIATVKPPTDVKLDVLLQNSVFIIESEIAN
jgi:S1-C subfamily serine protease